MKRNGLHILAAREARRDIRLLVLAEVAQGYFQLRALDADLEISRHTVKSFQDTLDIFERKFEGGAASGLEVAPGTGGSRERRRRQFQTLSERFLPRR